ncbi:MAG: hypothetical protein D3923_07645 [Candidatus Electrothrix sp. AR3]|nr:hypothetical protein [Candidatus Electrothrix sp. AR3]
MSPDTLGKIAVRGVGFLTILTFVKKVIGIGRNVVLARLLAPEDFGLLALAMVLIEGMDSLTSVGIDKYLIQKEHIDNTVIGNVWLLNIIRGVLLTLLALAICPLYSRLVNEPATLRVLWIVAFIPLLEGVKNPCSIIAERKIQLEKISIYETICAVLEVTVLVVLVWFIRDAVALAWGLLFGHFLSTLLSYFFFPLPKTMKFDLSRQLEMLSVAKHFAIISVGGLIMTQGDNLIIGALNGSEVLGYYVIAYQLAVFPIQFLQDITNRVALSVFSSLQLNKERLRVVLVDVIQIQMAVLIPFIIVTGVFSHELITMLYGDQWASSSSVLQALMLVTLGRGVTHVCVPYIIGTGAFSFASRIKFVETLIFLISVYIGTLYFGLIGAALGAGIGYMVAGIGRLIFMCRDAELSFFRTVSYMLFPAAAVIPGVLIAQIFANTVTWNKIVETIVLLCIVCISYAGFSFFIQRNLKDILFQKVLRSR